MKAAILANAALCVCPPLVATSVAVAVPSARHAVHRMTAPHHHQVAKRPNARASCAPVSRLVSAAALPAEDDALAAILSPAAEAVPAAPAYGSLSPLLISSSAGGLPGGPGFFPNGPGPITGTPPGPPVSPVAPVTQPAGVPEPASWMMMISGLLAVGVLCRRRGSGNGKSAKLTRGAAATTGLLSSGTLGPAQTAAIAGAKAGSALGAPVAVAIAKKAAVCVCAGAIFTTAVTTVPPLKRAAFAATAPARILASTNCEPDNR